MEMGFVTPRCCPFAGIPGRPAAAMKRGSRERGEINPPKPQHEERRDQQIKLHRRSYILKTSEPPPPPTLNAIRHKPLFGPYGRGFEHRDSLPDKTLGRNVPTECMFILAEHYVRTWTPYTTSKVIKSQNSFVRPETWNEKKQGSCSRKPVTTWGLCHTEYDRKVRPQTITAKELYAQSEVLYFFFRDCHNKRWDHSRSCQFKTQIERNGKEIIPGNAGCMMVKK
jgi:hypothetical protein